MIVLLCAYFAVFVLQINLIGADCGAVSRKEWQAVETKRVQYLRRPVDLVIIHQTESRNCVPGNYVACGDLVHHIQMRHMTNFNSSDIGYSFLMGGDSKMYEGAGWLHISNTTDVYSRFGITIAFIGNYDYDIPSTRMMRTVKAFLKCGVENGHLTPNYLVVAQSQLIHTISTGKNLDSEIMKLPEWEREVSAIKDTVLGTRYSR